MDCPRLSYTAGSGWWDFRGSNNPKVGCSDSSTHELAVLHLRATPNRCRKVLKSIKNPPRSSIKMYKTVSMSCFHYCFHKTGEMMGDAAVVVGNPGPFWINPRWGIHRVTTWAGSVLASTAEACAKLVICLLACQGLEGFSIYRYY